MKQLTIEQRCIIAGLLMGEGCIRIAKGNKHPEIYISNTKHELLAWLKEVTGVGAIYSQPSPNPNAAPCWRWYVVDALSVRALLLATKPHTRGAKCK